MGGGAVAERTVTNQFDLVVEALRHAVGDIQSGPGENAINMGFDQLSKFLHRFQAAVRRLPEPVLEESFGPEEAAVAPEQLKAFLQQISAQQAAVGLGRSRQGEQGIALAWSQVPGILQQDETCTFDRLLSRTAELADLLPTDLIEGIQAMLDQVEAVEHQRGVRKVLADGIGIRRPHITADEAFRYGCIRWYQSRSESKTKRGVCNDTGRLTRGVSSNRT